MTWHPDPEGTVRPAYGSGYWVMGRTAAYYVDPDEGTCGCPHHLHRLKRGDRCRHIMWLEAYLWRQGVERRHEATTEEELMRMFA